MSEKLTPSRRKFLRDLFTATVVSAAVPSVVLGKLVPKIRSSKNGISGLYTIDLTLPQYAVLKDVGGSVQIQDIPGITYYVILSRTATDTFVAVDATCPHEGCMVDPANTGSSASKDTLVCPCHNSKFKMDGTRISGIAFRSLTKLATTYSASSPNVVSIEIPGLVDVQGIEVAQLYCNEPRVNSSGSEVQVEYSNTSRANVAYSLTSALGATVLRGDAGMREAGKGNIVLNTSSLSAGAYVFTLVTGNGYSVSRKLLISR